jgi:hypothetical protein
MYSKQKLVININLRLRTERRQSSKIQPISGLPSSVKSIFLTLFGIQSDFRPESKKALLSGSS